ncbi:hypothetical protein RchiOBHm_Chr2g0123221 [Rosa chinensis]|uniref:Uncharacterized protein n=1 Tax=Rosa chinensis TaxID=74649 RepID=A0A2P6RSY9_ROSCH|nr:hypothetical protein RchiOBHm_Chr2g0123221 [Rosa chinensis]
MPVSINSRVAVPGISNCCVFFRKQFLMLRLVFPCCAILCCLFLKLFRNSNVLLLHSLECCHLLHFMYAEFKASYILYIVLPCNQVTIHSQTRTLPFNLHTKPGFIHKKEKSRRNE